MLANPEKENPLLLKNKIKVLEQQIEQKNLILNQIKKTEVLQDDKLKALKNYNEGKLKTLNTSIQKLKEENAHLKNLKSTLASSPNQNTRPIKENQNSHYFPKIQSAKTKNIRNVSADTKLDKNAPINEEKDKNNCKNNENIDVAIISKELENLKIENEKLKLKFKKNNDKFHNDLANKEKELLELRKIKIDYNGLNEKYEILQKKSQSIKSKEKKNIAGKEEIENLNQNSEENNAKLKIIIAENNILKEEIKKYKSRLSTLTKNKNESQIKIDQKQNSILMLSKEIQYNESDFINEKEEIKVEKEKNQQNEDDDKAEKNSQGQGKIECNNEINDISQGQGNEDMQYEENEKNDNIDPLSSPKKKIIKGQKYSLPSNNINPKSDNRKSLNNNVNSEPINKEIQAIKKNDNVIDSKPQIIFVLGGPGSGKGTQCSLLKEKYGFLHLSTGDVLRNSHISQTIESYIKEGKLVPSDILIDLLSIEILRKENKNKVVLLDGFPRNFENLEIWNKTMQDKIKFNFLLFFDCSNETLEKRILERAKSSGRADDNPESLKKRIITYENETKPIIEFFEKQNKLIRIDAERCKQDIVNDVEIILNTHKIIQIENNKFPIEYFYF